MYKINLACKDIHDLPFMTIKNNLLANTLCNYNVNDLIEPEELKDLLPTEAIEDITDYSIILTDNDMSDIELCRLNGIRKLQLINCQQITIRSIIYLMHYGLKELVVKQCVNLLTYDILSLNKCFNKFKAINLYSTEDGETESNNDGVFIMDRLYLKSNMSYYANPITDGIFEVSIKENTATIKCDNINDKIKINDKDTSKLIVINHQGSISFIFPNK